MKIASALLLALLIPAGQEKERRPREAVLCLNAEEPELSEKGADGGILIREIVRQAILIAARDSLGLATRDHALREVFPQAKGEWGQPINVHTLTLPGKSVRVRLTRGQGDARATIWEKTVPLPPGAPVDYPKLVSAAEELSRGEFVEALRKAGFAGEANPTGLKGRASDALERRLAQMTWTEQFAAVREMHEAFRGTGESPARLGAIIRGYAHLGQLAQGLWNASHKVFKARSLLYAERMAARYPGSRLPLWYRAYARTLAGLHRDALEDLAAADRIAEDAEPKSPAVPEWVSWIEACCRYDTPAVSAARADHHEGLLKFLGFLTVEQCGNAAYERAKILEAIRANPECYRLFDALCEVGGIGNLHEATLAGPKVLAARLYPSLLHISDLPQGVRELSEAADAEREPESRVAVAKALLNAADASEPSWSLVGRLIEETTFAQICRRGDFMRYKWSVPVDDFLAESAPLIAGHPFRAVVASFGLDARRQTKEWETLFKGLHVVDAEDTMLPLINATWNLDAKGALQGKVAWERVALHRDEVAADLESALRFVPSRDPAARKKAAHALLRVSPHSPHAIRVLVDTDWDFAGPKAAEWEKTVRHHPQVLLALGNRYRALEREADAERCLIQAVELAPSAGSYRALARVYRDQGKTEKWKETLDHFLEKAEDVGLEHASVRVEIARHYMDAKEWEKAKPYAEAAAQTWAQWAMDCARDCYEGLGDLEKAEQWQQRTSERYESAATAWYFWCKRMGFGNAAQAEVLAARRIETLSSRATTPDRELSGVFYVLSGKPRDALTSFRQALEAAHNPYNGLHAALLAQELKDTKVRDACLQHVVEKGGEFKQDGKPRTVEIEFATLWRNALAKGTTPDPKAVDAALKDARPGIQGNVYYFFGRLLELEGDRDSAKAYYERAAKTDQRGLWNLTLAADALRQRWSK